MNTDPAANQKKWQNLKRILNPQNLSKTLTSQSSLCHLIWDLLRTPPFLGWKGRQFAYFGAFFGVEIWAKIGVWWLYPNMQIFFFGNVRIGTKMGKLFAEIRGIRVKIVAHFDAFFSQQSKLSLFILSDYKKEVQTGFIIFRFYPLYISSIDGSEWLQCILFFSGKNNYFFKMNL